MQFDCDFVWGRNLFVGFLVRIADLITDEEFDAIFLCGQEPHTWDGRSNCSGRNFTKEKHIPDMAIFLWSLRVCDRGYGKDCEKAANCPMVLGHGIAPGRTVDLTA